MSYKRFFEKPSIDAIERDPENTTDPLDTEIPDISEETFQQAIENSKNPYDQLLVNTIYTQRKAKKLKNKIKDTIAYHRADLVEPVKVDPLFIEAFQALFGREPEIINGLYQFAPEELKCLEQLLETNNQNNNLNDELKNNIPGIQSALAALNMIESLSKKKIKFGLEFLIRLIRLCMAYAVHMIVGGLCSFFLGKINIPIPFIGSFPLGTMISASILAPTERTAKAALGFPCNPNIPTPDFCFDFFLKDKEAFNLLPCCIPAGISSAMLKLREFLEKQQGENSPLSSDIDKFLKSFNVKGSMASGNITIGSQTATVGSGTGLRGDTASILNGGNASIQKSMQVLEQGIKEGNSQTQDVKKAIDNLNEFGQNFTTRQKEETERAREEARRFSENITNTSATDLTKAVFSNAVKDWFDCIAQGIMGEKYGNDDRTQPPCLMLENPGRPTAVDIAFAEHLLNSTVQHNSNTENPKLTQSENYTQLINLWKQIDNQDQNLNEMKNFLKDSKGVLSKSKQVCLEELARLGLDGKFGGAGNFSIANSVADPEEFFSRLDTDNSMSNISLTPEAVTEFDGGDFGDFVGAQLPGSITDTFESVLGSINDIISEADKFVSTINSAVRFLISKEFCCVIYILVFVANAVKGQVVCPDNDISNFFKFSAKMRDKKSMAELKVILTFLKAIIDTIRLSLSVGLQINGITLPLKDLMEQVRYTISNISKLLIDMATEPIEKGLDSLLLNPSMQAIMGNQCPLAFDILAILKCGLEFFKLKLNAIAMELFKNNFENIELIRSVRIGGMRFKMLDMLSQLLGQMLNLMLNIGDCYDGNDFINKIVANNIEGQYNDTGKLLTILQNANIPPERFDAMTRTIDNLDPIDLSLTEEEIQWSKYLEEQGKGPILYPIDNILGFTNDLFSEKTIDLFKNSVPLSNLIDTEKKLVEPEEFVKTIENFTGLTVSEVIADIYITDSQVYETFKGKNG